MYAVKRAGESGYGLFEADANRGSETRVARV